MSSKTPAQRVKRLDRIARLLNAVADDVEHYKARKRVRVAATALNECVGYEAEHVSTSDSYDKYPDDEPLPFDAVAEEDMR